MDDPSGAGRFAPSPSADLHIGNLRTAVLAWLFARSTGRRFLMRVDDLDDRTHADIASRQLDDLAAIGLTWDEPAEWQTAASAALRRRRRRCWPNAGCCTNAIAAERISSRHRGRRTRRRAPIPARAVTSPTPSGQTRREETGRPPALRLRTDVDHLHRSRSAARRIHRDRRRFRGPPRRRCDRLQPRGRRRRRGTGRRPGGARRRPAGVVAAPGLPREPAGLSGADVCARRPGAQRGRGAAGQTRRCGDARRDRGANARSRRSRSPLDATATTSTRCSREFDPAKLPRQPWIYRPEARRASDPWTRARRRCIR